MNDEVVFRVTRAPGYLLRGWSAKQRAEIAARAYAEKLPIEGPINLPIEEPTLEQLAFAYGVSVASIQHVLNG
jgi:hypothetical protein